MPAIASRFLLQLSIMLATTFCLTTARAGQLPSDVRPAHWAADAVNQVLKSGVMSVETDHQFHGEAHVTRAQAIIALAAVAKKIESGTWQAAQPHAVPDRIGKVLKQGAWQSKTVTRYELASVLVRFANYFSKAVARPQPGAKDLAKSEVLPANVKIPVAPTSPAYGALQYLTGARMITPTSPLLKADSTYVKASELSRGVAEAADGLVDRLTPMGKDEFGNTPDKSFHGKKPAPRQ